MKRLCRIIFFLSSFPLLSSQICAQWNPVFSFGSSRSGRSGFFFNEFEGFIAATGDAGIFKTTDGGKTWIQANTPEKTNSDYITQIFMTNNLRGWATIETLAGKSLWFTSDGGLNWSTVNSVQNEYNNVYETPSAVIVLSRNIESGNPLYPVLVSGDKGTTFPPSTITLKNGIDFTDNTHGVMTGFTAGNGVKGDWLTTSDGGLTWNQINPVLNLEAWSVYAVKGSSIFYAAPENNYLNPPATFTTTIIRSSDNGSTWVPAANLNFLTTGHIAGVGETIYIQADPFEPGHQNGSGIYRSTDQGITWKSVQGPSHDRDTRFVVTGCNGGVVYAFDKNGNVWKTRVGGDSTIFEPPVEPQIYGNPINFSGTICSTSFHALYIQNLYCFEDTIVSATALDGNSTIISSGALTVLASPSFPLVLKPDTRDSLQFIWQPSKIFHTDTTVTIQVKVRYYSKALQQAFDTIVTVFVHAIGAPPSATVTPVNANFGTVSFCNPHDTTITIQNTGCDTLFITKENTSAGALFAVENPAGLPLSLPLIIPPNGIASMRIHLTLNSSAPFNGNLTLTLKHQGISRDTSITVSATGIASPGRLVSDIRDTLFDLKLTRCDTPKHFTIHLSNPDCTKITITSASLEPPALPDIQLSASSLPADLSNAGGQDTLPLTVTVSPILLGTYSGMLHIIYKTADGVLHDTLMSYFLSVNYGSRLLSTNVDTIDLGTMKLCDFRDSSILAKDIGCDSLFITGVQIQGDGNFTLTGNPKLNLAAGQLSRIPFHFVPVGAGNINGVLTVRTVSDSLPIRTIVLLAHVTPTDTVSFSISPTSSCFYAGDTMTAELIPNNDILGKNLSSVTFTLHYNGDLLTMIGSPSVELPGVIAGTGKPSGTAKNTVSSVSLLGSPTLELPAGKPIITLKFFVSLTDSISTRFDLTGIKLNGDDSVYERCELGILSAGLSYSLCYRCGDSIIVKYMQLGNNLNIFTDAVHPNPLTDQNMYRAEIPFTTNSTGTMILRVYDYLGREQLRSEIEILQAGKYSFPIDGKDLPAGNYFYSLYGANARASARGRFMVVK